MNYQEGARLAELTRQLRQKNDQLAEEERLKELMRMHDQIEVKPKPQPGYLPQPVSFDPSI
jgi:hypothetical protein